MSNYFLNVMPLKKRDLSKENKYLQKALNRSESIGVSISKIAVDFVYPSKLSYAIDRALKEILHWSGAERAVIMQVNPDDPEKMGIAHEVCRFGVLPIKRFAQNIPMVRYPYFEKKQRHQGYIAIPDVKKLPDAEASQEKALYKKQRVGSIAICSFTSRKKFNGYVGLMNRRPVKEWPPEIIRFLKTIAVLIEHSLERIETEKKLIEEKLRAEESNRMKTAFMANLSHEIRTPLNGILGFTKLLTNRSLTLEKQKHYAEIIDLNSHQLLTVINDLLDISKIESGVLKLEYKDIRINDLLTAIYSYFKNELASKNEEVDLKLKIPDQGSDYLLNTDPARLKQVIDNLMKNAIRFTPKGRITLGYNVGNSTLKIYVEDTGIGIDKKHQANIFKRFWKLDSSVASPFGSNGLGLSITYDLVNLMGGEIKLNSEPGKGSVFTVELPFSGKPVKSIK